MDSQNKPDYQMIGLDVGQRRVGVAVANSQIRISHPVAIVDFKQPQPWERLQKLIDEAQPGVIVIGQPKNQPKWWINWYNQFQVEIDCQAEIIFVNEVLTSREASNLRPDKIRIDDQAASLILGDYLERLDNE